MAWQSGFLPPDQTVLEHVDGKLEVIHAKQVKPALFHFSVGFISTPAFSGHSIDGQQQACSVRAMLAMQINRVLFRVIHQGEELVHRLIAGITPVIERNAYVLESEGVNRQPLLTDG